MLGLPVSDAGNQSRSFSLSLLWPEDIIIVMYIIMIMNNIIIISLYLLSDSMKVWLYQLLQGPSTLSCLKKVLLVRRIMPHNHLIDENAEKI